MGWLRSCYSTPVQWYQPDGIGHVRFFFVPEGTPCIPFRSIFYPRSQDPQLGFYPNQPGFPGPAFPWVNGSGPPVMKLDAHGTQADWLGMGQPPFPVLAPRPPEVIPCLEPQPPIDPDQIATIVVEGDDQAFENAGAVEIEGFDQGTGDALGGVEIEGGDTGFADDGDGVIMEGTDVSVNDAQAIVEGWDAGFDEAAAVMIGGDAGFP